MRNYYWCFVLTMFFYSCKENNDVQFSETEDSIKVYDIAKESLVQSSGGDRLRLKIEDITVGTEVTASVRVKNNNNKGGLIIHGDSRAEYIHIIRSSPGTKVDEEGYDIIKFHTIIQEPLKNDLLHVFVTNDNNDSVYYRDLHVELNPNPKFPYENYNKEVFKLKIDSSGMRKLREIRKVAFDKGVIIKGENDWVNALVDIEGLDVPCKLRIKGDWLDHIQGHKWSFRIKIKGDKSWHRMKEFSIQKPETRGLLYEWLYHEVLEKEDVLTTRYGFIPVELNGKKLGLYAFEEHFVKQLLEYRKRKEAPILKYDESGLWDRNTYPRDVKTAGLNVVESASVSAFKSNKTNKKPNLRALFEIGQTYLRQLKSNEVKASEVCNVDAFAKYYAITQLCLAEHGQIWHNMRFYINPVNGLLEPVAYDGFWENYDHNNVPLYLWEDDINCNKVKIEKFRMPLFMDDSVFVKKYNFYLDKYVNEGYVKEVLASKKEEINELSKLIEEEYVYHYFDSNYLLSNIELLKGYKSKINSFVEQGCYPSIKLKQKKYIECEHLKPLKSMSIKAYSKFISANKKSVFVTNFFCQDLEVKGFGNNGLLQYELKNHSIINRFDGKEKYVELVSPSNFDEVIFSLLDNDTLYSMPISKFSKPDNHEPRKSLSMFENNISKYGSLVNNTITFRGTATVTSPIYIPHGYNVEFEKGCKLDFINSSFFFSDSPVNISGSKNSVVNISSSDHTAKGFNVQSKQKSTVVYAKFDGLDAFVFEGWVLPGSVNFYKGNVELSNTIISNNVCEDALNIVSATFQLENCQFQTTWGDAFDADFSTGTINNCQYNNIGNDAMDFSTSEISISNCTVVSCGDKGLSGGEQSTLIVDNLKVMYANIGIASKDLSEIKVEKSNIEGCKYALMLYKKKPEYGPATLSFNNSTIKSEVYENFTQVGSNLSIDGVLEKEFRIIPKEIFQ